MKQPNAIQLGCMVVGLLALGLCLYCFDTGRTLMGAINAALVGINLVTFFKSAD